MRIFQAVTAHIKRDWTWYLSTVLFLLMLYGLYTSLQQNTILCAIGALSVCAYVALALICFPSYGKKHPKNQLTFWRVLFWVVCIPGILSMFYISPTRPGIYRDNDGTEVFFPEDQETMITIPGMGKFHGTSNRINVVFTNNPEPLITQKISIQAIPKLGVPEQIRAATELKKGEFSSTMEDSLARATEQYTEACLFPRSQADINGCLASIAMIAERSLGFPVECTKYRIETTVGVKKEESTQL